MYAIEFSAVPMNGMIMLPEEISDINSEIKLIAFYTKKEDLKFNDFKSLKINTSDYVFNRDEANER